MNDVLTGTPAELTYMHHIVVQAWTAVWAVTSGALVVIIGWIGLTLVVSEHLGRPQAGWRELVPRLVLGLVAAASSLWWCALDHRHRRRDLRLHRRIARLHRRRPDEGIGRHAAHGGPDRERGRGHPHRHPLPGLRLLRPLRPRADAAAHRTDRPAAGARAHRAGALDTAAHRRMGAALAAPVHDRGLPAGGPAHRTLDGIHDAERVRRHRHVRAGPGPHLEAHPLGCVHLPRHAGALPARQRGHVRRVAPHPLLRHVAPRHGHAGRPVDRADARGRRGRTRRHGRRSYGGPGRGECRGRHRRAWPPVRCRAARPLRPAPEQRGRRRRQQRAPVSGQHVPQPIRRRRRARAARPHPEAAANNDGHPQRTQSPVG